MFLSNVFSNPQIPLIDYKEDEMSVQVLESKILQSSGLLLNKTVWSYDVKLPDSNDYIHTLEVGRGNPEKLVLIHGFGQSSIYYWHILSRLQHHFNVFAIDQLGTGLSSRPDHLYNEYQSSIDVLTKAIE